MHGDLDARHLIFNHKHLTGIIDWGDCGINHSVVDLAVIWSFYPQSCHQLFFKYYGAVDEHTWQYARFLGLWSALTLFLYGCDIGDASLAAEAASAVNRFNGRLIC